jgi:hypothetical protein
MMNPLLFECPTTKRPIEVGLCIDYASMRSVQPVTIRLVCPLCDGAHEWTLHEGWIRDPPEAEPTAPAPPLAAWSPCRDDEADAPADIDALSNS